MEEPFWQRVSKGAGEAFIDAVIFGALGSAVDRARGTGGKWTRIGAGAGGALGFAAGSRPEMVQICQQQQPVQQVVVTQPQIVSEVPRNPCFRAPGTVLGVLRNDFPGDANGHRAGDTVCARPGDTNISRWL